MPHDPNEIDYAVEEIATREARYRNSLRLLLDWLSNKENHLTAVSANMGATDSYITSVSLKWIASNVLYAKDLPIFKEHILEVDGRISINDITINYIQQREPDYRRQLPMALYLATRKYHKFGPLVIVAYQDWIYDENSNKWGPDGKALEASLNMESVDSKMYLVDLDIANTKYFALDGQHRLMAIKGLELLINGRLEAKRIDGTSIPKKSITNDEIEEYYLKNKERLGLNINDFQGLLDDVMGIEIIPAVQFGETLSEAISRLRNIFVDINENAKRLEKGELTLLDENNGFRIVARSIIANHTLFWERVEVKKSNVTKTSDHYTALTTVVEICKEYLQTDADFQEWLHPILGVKELGFLRPYDEEIKIARDKMIEYFDALMTIPSHKDMVQGTAVNHLRNDADKDNILFWAYCANCISKSNSLSKS